MEPNNELTLAQKVKAVGTMTLVTGVLLASAVGYTSYQRNAKVEAAALLQKQIAAVMAKKAILPLFKDTKEFKEIKEKTMVKVNQSSLPTTVTAEFVSSNCEAIPPGAWFITKGVTSIADNDTPNGWSVSAGGSVGIPALDASDYGIYDFRVDTGEDCGGGNTTVNYYQLKIVPPCPTSVTLTVTPTG